MPIKRVPLENEKLRAIDLLYNRLNQAFVLYFWVRRVQPMLAAHSSFSDADFEIGTIHNACVASTLMSIRSLDDFFRLKEQRKDKKDKAHESDVHVTDFFGFQSSGSFLSETERESIHRWIAHQTYHPIWTGKTGIAPDSNQEWNTADLVEKAARALFGFMDFLERDFSQKDSDKVEGVRKMKTIFENRLQKMKAMCISPC